MPINLTTGQLTDPEQRGLWIGLFSFVENVLMWMSMTEPQMRLRQSVRRWCRIRHWPTGFILRPMVDMIDILTKRVG